MEIPLSNKALIARVNIMRVHIMYETEIEHIISDEGGDRDITYKDSMGLLTGGVGHLLTLAERKTYPLGAKIPKEVRDAWLTHDLVAAEADTSVLLKGTTVDTEARNIVFNMAFNMGRTRLRGFRNMFKALRTSPPDYQLAAAEMKDSRWYHQVGYRAKRLITRMENIS
jgi:lysozyme